MRFHVLGVSFAPTNKDYSCEGFSQKVRLFCKMMMNKGHTVFHYGIEGSNPECTENINVLSKETYDKVHKSYDYKKNGFLYYSETEAQDEFNFNSIIEIEKRKQLNDFLCFSFGFPQRPIYEAHIDLIASEIGVGFDGSFAPHRVFESYAWMHTIYGKEDKLQNPSIYDSVIPNYYDLEDYIFSEEKDDYFFFIARMDPLKGLEIAALASEYAGYKLVTAGIGTPHIQSPNIIHVGVVDFEQRAKLMSRAKATFVTTNYLEPYGSTVVESLLCGTPVISTDFGAFTENVIHGRVGYRCRTLEQFYWAAKNIDKIKPIDCRNYAVENYEIDRIGEMYEEYFGSLYKLNTNREEGWYQKDLLRNNLNWLYKYLPDVKKEEADNREIVCFLVGYTPDLFEKTTKNNYGSEITLVRLAEEFAKKYKVYIFGEAFINEKSINNVEYLNISKFEKFQKDINIDYIILSRYIYHFLDYEFKSKKLFIWVHDCTIMPYYKGINLGDDGKGLLKNVIDKIDGIITLSEWHRDFFIENYEINGDKVFIINSAITPSMFKGNLDNKQKNRFIWTSHGGRGFNIMLNYFHKIREHIPDAELYVYRDPTAFNEEHHIEMLNCDYIHYGGKLEHNKIPDEFEKSEYWFYPTNFTETYCMSAVEAQMSKCVCIASNLGALTETIYDRGILINEQPGTEEYINKVIYEIKNLSNNKKKDYLNRAYTWAKEQTWNKRAEQWYILFNKK